MRRKWATLVLTLVLTLGGFAPAHAQAVPQSFLLYPNYRGLIFDDRPEIVVEAPSGASVTVADATSGSVVASATTQGPPVTIAATTLTQDHAYTVNVTSAGATIGTWTVTPVPASRRASMNISFDPKGRLLMHGTPRFALGVYDSGLGYTTSLSTWEDMLFSPTGARQLGGIPLNMYLNFVYGQAPLSAMQPLMTTLQNHGIMYLQTGNCFASGSYTRIPFSIDTTDTYPQQFGQHPGAAGYYIADECVESLVPETNAHHARLSRLSPGTMDLNVLLAKGYIDARTWTESADVLGSDPYPLYGAEPSQGYAHFNVADFVAMTKNGVRDMRPTFAVLQFFQFTTDSRWPTFAEERTHAIMSIVEGAKGIFWWQLGPSGLRKSDAATVATEMANLKTMVTELAALEPALVSDDVPGALTGNSTRYADPIAGRKLQLQKDITTDWLYSNKTWYQAELTRLNAGDTSLSPMLPDAATIRTKVKLVNGVGYVFAYNYTNVTTPVTFTWYQAPGTVTENLSRQTYPVSGSSWTDSFGPYESRIYVLSNGGTGPGGTPPPPPPPAPVTTAFTNPAAGATVSATTTVSMSASGGTPPYTYNVDLDGQSIYSGANASFSWNTTAAVNGPHTLTATTTDAKSQAGAASLSVTVSNVPSFTADFTDPLDGATVSGSQSVGMSTTAPSGQSKTFVLSVDGNQVDTTTTTGTTWSYTWNSASVSDGTHTLGVAVTYSGQTVVATRTVTTSNTVTPPPPPPPPLAASFTSPAADATVGGTTTIDLASTGGASGARTFTLALVTATPTATSTTTLSTQTVTGTTASYAWDTTTTTNGAATLTLTVTDSAGASTTTTLPVTVSNSVTPPAGFTAAFTSPTDGAVVSGYTSVGMSTTAPRGRAKAFTFYVDGVVVSRLNTTATTYSYTWRSRTVANGPHTLKVTVTYNGATASATLALTVKN